MITQQECEKLILDAYQQDKTEFTNNPSRFKNNVWWENSNTCFSYFDKSISSLTTFLENPTDSKHTHNAATSNEKTETKESTHTQQPEQWKPQEKNNSIFNILWRIVIAIILLLPNYFLYVKRIQ